MFKNILRNKLLKQSLVSDYGKLSSLYCCRTSLHDGKVLSSPRSFFGVEDFVDDDNSRPYTYQKQKKPKSLHKHVSFKQRTIAYMEPFTLDVFISKRFVSASLTHRVTCKQVAVAGTNSKDVKAALKSRSDIPACLAIGRILAERAREADVYTASYTPRERDKFEGKIRAVVTHRLLARLVGNPRTEFESSPGRRRLCLMVGKSSGNPTRVGDECGARPPWD